LRRLFFNLVFLTFLMVPVNFLHAENKNIELMLKEKIELFAKVADGLYRGAQPSDGAYPLLKQLGIKTVVNFRHESNGIEKDRKLVEAAGMKYVSLPWKIFEKPAPEVMERFFSIMNDPAQKPVFVHCRRGAERTGVACVLYRMKFEGKSREEAENLELKPYPVNFIWKPFVKKRISEFQETSTT